MVRYAASVLLLLAAGHLLADDPKNLAFDTELERIVVFKEGFGFYVRRGSARLENGWATTSLAPAAVNGTFWVFPTQKGDRIEQLVATRENVIRFEKPEEIKKALEDKIGLSLKLTAEGTDYVGKLSGLLPTMLLLEANKKFSAISYDSIQSIQLVGYPIRIKVRTDNPRRTAGFVFGYVQDGIRWEPGYLLQVREAGKSMLTMRATLVGIPEKVENVTVQFVVGAPRISELGKVETLLRDFVSLSRSRAAVEDDMVAQQRDEAARLRLPSGPYGGAAGMGGGYGGLRGGEPTGAEAPVLLEGTESGELFYYTAEGISMGPRDVATVIIFERPVTARPRFEWQADTDSLDYILQVENETGVPLTTGPTFVVDNEKPLGQGIIRYTPVGATSEVRLAKGVGLRTSIAEVELSRGEPFVANNRRYVTVRMNGTLELENFRVEKVEVKILRTVKGKVAAVSDGGTVKSTALVRDGTEPTNLLEWVVEVEPGKKRAVTYTYEVTIAAGA